MKHRWLRKSLLVGLLAGLCLPQVITCHIPELGGRYYGVRDTYYTEVWYEDVWYEDVYYYDPGYGGWGFDFWLGGWW